MGSTKKLRLATVFSGIGAVEQALNKLKVPYEIVFACDNGERELKDDYQGIIDFCGENKFTNKQINEYVNSLYAATKRENLMKKSYFANYEINEDSWYEDIRFIDGTQYKDQIDLFVGGSPCQSFSMIGKRAGLEDVRGTLFYEYARLIKEMQPKVFIYENVVGMLNHDKGNTWTIIKSVFESLGYDLHIQVLNSKDYGIPQNRRRLFVVGFKNKKAFEFPSPIDLCDDSIYRYLESNVEAHFYLGKKGFEFVSNPKNSNRARVNEKIIKTQKANQQFNWNGDFVFEKLDKRKHTKEILDRAYIGDFNGERGVIRQLTNRECLRLMGFSDDFNIVVNKTAAYRQAGNSIVVNVLENILREILKVEFQYE